ncbi:unnamed protein product [Didymodactylos carnosus]|uniref:Uncharacterized protein n=1 Tax=Didymodactylos carnosus TaxID=1234261 RepID=A0A814GKJ8_9BILA|nr:unnamed protein product [Didymodactylos carnosus]CAF1295271.1 unnamed protein product [Didymodactylos carnosus]CAF3769295.1 unnamed protein product [Didymodactylos carnosus]CAF4100740.1 unnamed protein product [Didymodactylos carnosus]
MSLFQIFLVLFVSILYGLSSVHTTPPPSDAPRQELSRYIANVKQADRRLYSAKDHVGHTMDCVKIIPNSEIFNEFIAVYHTYINGIPKVNLATSTDLMTWTWIRELASQASQPAISISSDGGFILIWEQEPRNHLKFVYFKTWSDLQQGIIAKSYDALRTLSVCAEGTPNIYRANSTYIEIGYHYYWNCDVDRQARGTLINFKKWQSTKQQNLDNALLHWGVKGNIGDRDAVTYDGYDFTLIEGQYAKKDFGTWRTFIYDYQTGNADQLNIETDGGSQAFANPTITFITIDGQRAILVTLFVPSENSAPGEAGELIYYKKY